MKNLISIFTLFFILSCSAQEPVEVNVNFIPKRELILEKINTESRLSVLYIPFDVSIKKTFLGKIRLSQIFHSSNSGRVHDGIVSEFLLNGNQNYTFKYDFSESNSYNKELYLDYVIELKDPKIEQELKPFFITLEKNDKTFVKISTLEQFKKQCPYTYQKVIKDNKRFLIVDFYDNSTDQYFVKDFPIKL